MSDHASNPTPPRVDFDAVRENARKQNVPLSEIAIMYSELNAEEIAAMKAAGALVGEAGSVGRFLPDGSVMYPEKAHTVYSLSA